MDIEQYLFPPRIAVVEVAGQIGARLNPREMARTFSSIAENPRYPAVVLDIDSPGGGAAASEALYLAAKRLSDKKPVAAAIRGVGASGGYMIACAANPIFALPTSVVGSIGVIWTAPMISEALDRVGVKMRTRAAGEYKDMGSLFRENTPEEDEKLDALDSLGLRAVRRHRRPKAAPSWTAIVSPSLPRGRSTPAQRRTNSVS